MTDITEKSYSPKKFRRKIPKVSRNYKRNIKEPKSFDKSEEELEMEKSLVNEVLTEVLEKGKKYPIGTVHNGYKKIAEGRWEKDTNGAAPGGKVQVSDKHKEVVDKHSGSKKAKDAEYDRVGKLWESALNDDNFEETALEGLPDELQDSLKQLNNTVKTLHGVSEEDEDFDAISEAMEEANDAVQEPFNTHLKDFKPDLNKDKKEKAKEGPDAPATGPKAKEAAAQGAIAQEEVQRLAIKDDESPEAQIRNIEADIGVFERKLAKIQSGELKTKISIEEATAHYEETLDKLQQELKDIQKVKKSIIQETDMSDINKEMDQMADKMEKSADPKAVLKATIQQVGIEGLKKAMPSLDDEQKELLKEVLEEIKVEKAVSMDDAYDGDKKFITVDKMGVEVEDGSDDEDEKLVKLATAAQNHQGDVSPEGREGHVIKSVDETIDEVLKGFGQGQPVEDSVQKPCGDCESYSKTCKACSTANGMMKSEDEYEMPKKEAIDEHKRLVNVLDSKDRKDDKVESKKQKKELKEMQKSEETIMKSKEELIALKDEIVKSYDDAGLSYNDELIKGEMKKRLLKEESQVEPTDQTKGGKKDKADKPSVPEIEVGKDADETADEAVAKVGKMKKSISYDSPNKRLAANTGGRNHHFSINGYYDEALQKAASEGKEVETLEKSEGEDEKVDGLNDIIEKGLDKDSDECKTEELFKSQTKGENVQKSFADDDMVEAMNMSKEDAEKVLGK